MLLSCIPVRCILFLSKLTSLHLSSLLFFLPPLTSVVQPEWPLLASPSVPLSSLVILRLSLVSMLMRLSGVAGYPGLGRSFDLGGMQRIVLHLKAVSFISLIIPLTQHPSNLLQYVMSPYFPNPYLTVTTLLLFDNGLIFTPVIPSLYYLLFFTNCAA